MAEKRFYITTPIFYPNAKLHMGHAYTTVISDILARHHRLLGEKTHFLTGSDENTQKMVDAAGKEGKEPLVFLDGIVENFKTLYQNLDISYDQFIRTTDQKIHWPGAVLLWENIKASGDLYEKEYEGLYCTGHEAFLTPKDFVDGKCPDHGTAPEMVREKNYFFKLSKYTDILKEKIESDELRIIPQTRKKEILSFISEGLEDISFSRLRRKDWPSGLGIGVPGDDSQVMYVWCDALSNYATAVGYGRDETMFKTWWPADVHVIGKDILRFHAAIWPAILLSAGLPLPKSLLVHGFITSGGKKMSKSLGNVIDPLKLIEEYGSEAVRYFLSKLSTFEDGDLTPEAIKETYNADLANGLGNLVSRIMKMTTDHKVDLSPEQKAVSYQDVAVGNLLKNFNIAGELSEIWTEIASIDEKIQKDEPFKTIKTEPERARKDLYAILERLFNVALRLEPYMPETSKRIIEAIKTNKKPENLFPRKD